MEDRRKHVCEREQDWGMVQQYIKNQDERWERMETKFCKHVDEGERSGGVRDRLLITERKVEELEKRRWVDAFVGGIIGALLGQVAPEVIATVIKWVTGR